MKNNILIVEPHFDDAWINLGGYILLHPTYNFFIMTLSDYPTNYTNGTKLLQKILKNISGRFCGYKSLGFEDPLMTKMIEKYNTKDYEEIFLKINNLKSLKSVKDNIKQNSKNFDRIFWPLGMKHPQHILMNSINPFNKFYYYREFPYYFYRNQKNIIDKLTLEREKTVVNISSVLDKKITIINDVYKDQTFLLDLEINNVKLKFLNNEMFWKIT